jgi:hypothetical protein
VQVRIFFITENDIWGGSQALYPVNKTMGGVGVPFEDRQHILYVNASYKGDDDIGRLMHDFLCSDPDDMFTEMLAEKARYLKTDPKGVDIMCKAMEDLREESIQRGIDQNRVESIKNLMQTLKLTAQQAMDALLIPVTEQSKYAAKL